MIGRTVGRYRISEELGRGGMGVVYKATQTTLNRTVAIKMLSPHLAESREHLARFRQEAEVLARLQHENIVHIYDIEELDGRLCIVMEFVAGPSLTRVLARERTLPPALVRDVTVQLASGLAVAHRKGIVHRDLKPDNIVFTPEGRPRITDFGIARMAGDEGMIRTRTGVLMGTPHYMSPEQARGTEVTGASDLYSLGVLLYEMLTGRVPFHGSDPISVAIKHVQEEPRPLREILPGIPPALAGLVHRALQKDPVGRFRSAEEMGARLRALRLGPAPPSIFGGEDPVEAGAERRRPERPPGPSEEELRTRPAPPSRVRGDTAAAEAGRGALPSVFWWGVALVALGILLAFAGAILPPPGGGAGALPDSFAASGPASPPALDGDRDGPGPGRRVSGPEDPQGPSPFPSADRDGEGDSGDPDPQEERAALPAERVPERAPDQRAPEPGFDAGTRERSPDDRVPPPSEERGVELGIEGSCPAENPSGGNGLDESWARCAIGLVMERQRIATERGDERLFARDLSTELARRHAPALRQLHREWTGIRSEIRNPSVRFTDPGTARVDFHTRITGTSRGSSTPAVISETRVYWTVERSGGGWVVVAASTEIPEQARRPPGRGAPEAPERDTARLGS